MVVQVIDLPEEDGPVLGSLTTDADEASFLASLEEDGSSAPPPAAAVESNPSGPMPDLASLVARIPPGVREMMDDLFRAKFSGVRRVPIKALKTV